MSVGDLVAALNLPASALVNQRIPKKLLVENGAPTSADKRRISEGIEEIQWIAALKPANAGIPEYRDEVRAYLEIAVLSVSLRAGVQPGRLAELVHRAIPYPVFLILVGDGPLMVSLAHIRWAQNEADKVVLDGTSVQASVDHGGPGLAFLHAVSLVRQPRGDLAALYRGWADTLTALEAASFTGEFRVSTDEEQAAARRAALQQCRELDVNMNSLRAEATKEKQLARQVDLNLELKRLDTRRRQLVASL
jgi:hypothetical protein